VAPEDYDGLARLRAGCGIPLAAGENVPALLDFERLLARRRGLRPAEPREDGRRHRAVQGLPARGGPRVT